MKKQSSPEPTFTRPPPPPAPPQIRNTEKRTLGTLLQAGVIKGRKQYSKAVAALLSVEGNQGDQ